jgi:hypothetical protein
VAVLVGHVSAVIAVSERVLELQKLKMSDSMSFEPTPQRVAAVALVAAGKRDGTPSLCNV